MNIYTSNDYRKIWEHYNGPIPKDENGRTYDIHHIDGNHNNNDPENLIAVSIDEHYNIHYSQGDYLACSLIELRRNKSPELISFLISENAKKRVEERTHHLLKREDGSSLTSDRTKAGTNPFQTRPDGTNLNTDRVKAGTFHLLKREDGTSVASDRVESGTHNWLKREDGSSIGKEINDKRAKDGTHHLLKREDGTSVSSDRVEAGTHNWLNNKGTVACYDKQGNYVRIPKEQFHSQSGTKEDWNWVTVRSNEGKRRKISFHNFGINFNFPHT